MTSQLVSSFTNFRNETIEIYEMLHGQFTGRHIISIKKNQRHVEILFNKELRMWLNVMISATDKKEETI